VVSSSKFGLVDTLGNRDFSKLAEKLKKNHTKTESHIL